MLSPKQFEYYSREKRAWESRGHNISFTDLWGLIIEYFLNQEVREQEVTIFFPPLLPFYAFLLPDSYLNPGVEPSKSVFSKVVPARHSATATHWQTKP